MKLRLNSIQLVTNEIFIFSFRHPHNNRLPKAEPGAHISIHLPKNMIRQYSLLNYHESPEEYIIGVKREDNGRGGSLYMHQSLRVGEEYEITPPENNFPLLLNKKHSVLIAGGIGITPIYCMANFLRNKGDDFTLFYACRSKQDAIYYDELNQHKNVFFHFDDEEKTFFNMQKVIQNAPKNSQFYCCGPEQMLSSYQAETAEIPNENIHFEAFSTNIEPATEGGYTIVLNKSGKQYNITEGKTILQVLTNAGHDVPFSCEQGICGTCETVVIEGIPDHRDVILTDDERESNKTIMICCSGSKTKKLVLDL